MRVFAFFVMIFGIAVAGGAMFYADKFLDAQANAVRLHSDTVRILVAAQPLSRGEVLGVDDLKLVAWPATSVPDGAFASTEALFGPDHSHRRYVTRSIEPGEPILDSRISDPNKAGSIKDMLPPGYRAVSIRVDDVSSVSGFVAVGDHVDVLLTHSPEGALVSSVILQDVKVLAVGQSIDTERNQAQLARTVTILVTVRESQLMSLAQQKGRLSLILRGGGSVAEDKAPSVGAGELDDLLKPKAAPGKTIRLRKGTDDLQDVPIR
jgi:pilus assembly protein CpaB